MAPRAPHRAFKTTDERVGRAERWIDLSGILDHLAPAERGLRAGAGRPVQLVQYSIRALLIVMAEIALDGRPLTSAEITLTIWCRYSDKILRRLGLEGIRDARTLEQIQRAARPGATAADIANGRRAEARARRRIIDAWEQATVPINDNVAPANRRITNRELKAARASTDVSAQRAARIQAFNLLIQGSVYAGNEWFNSRRSDEHAALDPKDIAKGIMSGWRGDLAIDETDVDYSIATLGRGNDLTSDDAYHPIAEMAEFFRKPGSRLQWPNAIGLTFAIAVARPESRRVPTIALAGSIDQPSAGSATGAMAVIDAIDDADLSPALASNAHQYVVVDQAYPHRKTWARDIADRNRSQVVRYGKTTARVHGLRACSDKNGTVAAHLFNGVPVCPGFPGLALRRANLDVPLVADVGGDRHTWGKRLHAHAELLAQILPFVMPRHGRPVHVPDHGPGRPPAGASPRPDITRMKVVCPAVAGQVRCPLVPQSMEADPTVVPPVENPPLEADRPATCQSSYTRLRLDYSQFRHYQPIMAGDYRHEDFYTSARSRNEGFHAALLHGTAGHLARGDVKPWKNAFVTIAYALAVGATNLHIIEQWNDVLASNGGKAPLETHDRNQRRRKTAVAEYLANKRRSRSH